MVGFKQSSTSLTHGCPPQYMLSYDLFGNCESEYGQCVKSQDSAVPLTSQVYICFHWSTAYRERDSWDTGLERDWRKVDVQHLTVL